MIALPLRLLLVSLPLLAPPALAASTFQAEHTESARGHESEVEVCRRARDAVQKDIRQQALAHAPTLPAFERLYDLHLKLGEDRQAIMAALSVRLEPVAPVEMRLFWSGKSCLYKGFAEVDLERVLEEMRQQAEVRKAQVDTRRSAEPDSGDRGWQMPRWVGLFEDQAAFDQALGELSTFRVMVTEFHAMSGEWPDSLMDLGFTARDRLRYESVHEVEIGPGGVITARLGPPLAGEHIVLRPEASSVQVTWRCTTTLSSWAARSCR